MRMPAAGTVADATGHHPPDGRIQPPALTAGGGLCFRNQPAEGAGCGNCNRMQFGKSSEKLRAKKRTADTGCTERISALQGRNSGKRWVSNMTLPSIRPAPVFTARKPLPASLPRETRVIRPEEECCPACGGELSSLGCDVSEQLGLSAAPLGLSKRNVRNWPVAVVTISCRRRCLQNPLHAAMPERGFWPMSSPGSMQTICRYTASQKYTVVRVWR